jgi:hypothetical protein
MANEQKGPARNKKENYNTSGKLQARRDRRYTEAVDRAERSYKSKVEFAMRTLMKKYPNKKELEAHYSEIDKDPVVLKARKTLYETRRKEDRK